MGGIRIVLAILAAAAVAACTSPTGGSGSVSYATTTSASATSDAQAELTAAPPQEPSAGDAQPPQVQPTKPSVMLPGLPMSLRDDTRIGDGQCLGISYAGPIPDGAEVTVEGMTVDQSKSFWTATAKGCSNHPACGPGFAWKASTKGDRCSVIAQRTGVTGDDSDHAELNLSGRLTCPVGAESACNDAAAESGGLSIDLDVPEAENVQTSSTSTTSSDSTPPS